MKMFKTAKKEKNSVPFNFKKEIKLYNYNYLDYIYGSYTWMGSCSEFVNYSRYIFR